MNDWEISKFLELIMVLQVSILVLLVLDTLGIHIPILRDFVAFFYLLFVPGMLLLRIMRLHKLGNIETLLYTVGLSIATLMFVGAFMNLVYPLFGISKPISLVPLMATLTLIVCFFVVLSYKMDKNFADADTIEIKTFSLIFLCFLPFLAVFGTYLMNFYNLNVVLIFLILIICLLIISVAFNKIPKEYYAFTVFVVSISLLFHVSLISNYLTGWDIQQEYYLASLVVKNSYWNHTIYTQCNAMLSVTILPSLFSIISGVNLVWIFKIIYPLLFSLVPLGLYEIFKKQTNPEIAFFSCLLFVSFFAFYNDMLGLARQQIAELFLVLSVMLMLSKMERSKKQILFIFFGLSIILSHYSIAVLYISALVGVLIFSYLSRTVIFSRIATKLPKSLSNFVSDSLKFMNVKSDVINLKSVLVFVFVASVSYWVLASSSTAILISSTVKHILMGIFEGSFGTSSSQGLGLLSMETSPLHRINKYVYIASQIFMVFGFLKIFSSKNFKKFHFNKDYMMFVFLSFLTLAACMLIPFFASALNMSRFYHIALIFLAPISIIGGIEFFRFIISKLKLAGENKKSIELLSIFLVVFLLFNSGLVYALANDNSQSIALNSSYDTANYNQMEVSGSRWLENFGLSGWKAQKNHTNGIILADDYRRPLMRSSGFEPLAISLICINGANVNSLNSILKTNYSNKYGFAYLFFGTKNVNGKSVLMIDRNGVNNGRVYYESLNNFIVDENKIYDAKCSQIYYEEIR